MSVGGGMKRIVISTGAGISAESGVPTFRDADGLWARFDPMEVAHIDGWRHAPQKVIDFFNARRARQIAGDHRPNAAHLALVRLEKGWSGQVTIVTQNIDGLHRRAGSAQVFEMHGNGAEKRCDACGHLSAYDRDISLAESCEACGRTGVIRPHVVLFGEAPLHLDEITRELRACDIFAVIGSSLEVSPANQFVYAALDAGAETVLINKDVPETDFDPYWTRLYGNATALVPAWVDSIMATS